jgi:hypothetical protein
LIKSKDIVQGLGYELLYADTDSVLLKRSGATFDDFVSVKDILARGYQLREQRQKDIDIEKSSNI